jgi:hypothetical protein
MQQTKALTKQIATYVSEDARLESDTDRCNAAIKAADEHNGRLIGLQQQKADEIAQAFVDQRSADIAEIDKEIAVVEKMSATARDHGEAARNGVAVIEQRHSVLGTELAAARSALKAVILEEVQRRRLAASEKYKTAVDALREPLAELRGLDSVSCLINQRYGTTASERLVGCLADEGLRVPVEGVMRKPAWLPTIDADARENYAALANEFRTMGLDI